MSTQHTPNGADNRLTYTREQLTTARQQRDELLAALREVERWDSVSGIDDEWPSVMQMVRAAIAKATAE